MSGVTRKSICHDCGLEDKDRSNVNIRADNLERCNECAAKIEWPSCKTCGVPKQDYTDAYNHIPQIANGDCFSCYHWSSVFSKGVNKSVRTAKGDHYSYNANKPFIDTTKESYGSKHLGHAGRAFAITYLEEGVTVITNNLWYQGEMPAFWLNKYPPNAIVEAASIIQIKAARLSL